MGAEHPTEEDRAQAAGNNKFCSCSGVLDRFDIPAFLNGGPRRMYQGNEAVGPQIEDTTEDVVGGVESEGEGESDVYSETSDEDGQIVRVNKGQDPLRRTISVKYAKEEDIEESKGKEEELSIVATKSN